MLKRPVPGEYGPYYERYIRLVPEGDLLTILERQQEETSAKLSAWNEEKSFYRYAEGKWSVKELVHHVADTERVMAYRLLRAARGDKTPLPGFDQDLFVLNAHSDRIPWSELCRDQKAVRESTLQLLRTLSEEAWSNKGHVNGHDMTALSLACLIYGHALHHWNVLNEKYAQGFL